MKAFDDFELNIPVGPPDQVAEYRCNVRVLRALAAKMLEFAASAPGEGEVLRVTFPVGDVSMVYSLTPEQAEQWGRAWADAITRYEIHLRGPTQPLGCVEVITRDDRGEIAKVETRYKF